MHTIQRSSKTALLWLVLCITLPSALLAQNRGNIRGTVLDRSTKQPLPGANVIIVGTTTGAATDADGQFLIDGLAEGVYKLQAQYIGYQSHLETDVRVVRGKTTVIEIELAEVIVTSDSLIVTAGLFVEDPQAPVSTYAYTQEEIRRSPGAVGDIFRAIETLPGVSSSGGEFSAFSVRGGGPRDNLILVDNIPFDKVTHLEGGTESDEAQGGRFSIFAPNLIAGATFQAGGFSARYGGKREALLSLQVKEGNQDTRSVSGRFDLLGWELNYDGPSLLSNTTSVLLSARRQHLGRVLRLTNNEAVGVPSFSDFIVKTTTHLSPNHKISVLGIYAPERFERKLSHILRSQNFEDTALAESEERGALLGLNWRFLTSPSSFLQSTLYYRGNHRDATLGKAYPERIAPEGPPTNQIRTRENIIDRRERETEVGLRSTFSYVTAQHHTITAGIDANVIALDYDLMLNGADTLYVYDRNDARPNSEEAFIILRPAFINASFDDTALSAAAYAEYSFTLADRLTLNPGLRYEYNGFNKQSYLSPRFSARFVLDPKTRLNFASGIFYQTPRFQDITADAKNVDLKNEQSIHVILGLTRYVRHDLKFTAEGYYKRFGDLVVIPDRTRGASQNSGNGWAGGVDLSIVKRLVRKLYGQVNYSYAVSKRDDNLGEAAHNAAFNQPHTFNLLMGYELNRRWSFSAKWKYATGRPTDAFVVHEDVHNDPDFLRFSKEITAKNTRRFPDLHSLNFRVDYRRQFGPLALISFIDVLNVYNHLNVTQFSFIERTGENKPEGVKIIPTLGLKLEL